MARIVVMGVVVAVISGCSSYHEVSSVGELEKGQRAVIGRMVFVNGDISDWVPGTYLSSDLVFSDHLPLDDDGHPDLNAFSGDELSDGFSSFGADGGFFSVGIDAKEHYLLGIRAASTHWLWSTTSLLPMIARIPQRVADCEYVGSLYVRRAPDGILEFLVRDELDENRAALEAKVQGCKLVRNLAFRYRPR